MHFHDSSIEMWHFDREILHPAISNHLLFIHRYLICSTFGMEGRQDKTRERGGHKFLAGCTQGGEIRPKYKIGDKLS